MTIPASGGDVVVPRTLLVSALNEIIRFCDKADLMPDRVAGLIEQLRQIAATPTASSGEEIELWKNDLAVEQRKRMFLQWKLIEIRAGGIKEPEDRAAEIAKAKAALKALGDPKLEREVEDAATLLASARRWEETGWLIETARQTWWDGRQVGDKAYFTPNALDAIRFSRFEDAELVRCWLLEKLNEPQKLRSVEHIFCDRPNADRALATP